MPKLTKRVVDAAAPPAKQKAIVWDVEVKGFGLVTHPTGIKSYVFDYRTPEGRKRRITIGKHGDWTAEQARRKAEDYRRIVRDGGDPLGAKQALRASLTVSDILDAYLASPAFADKAAITQAVDRGRIERHLRPLLGKRHAHLVTKDDVRRAFAAIRDGKTATNVKTGSRGLARVRGGPGAARMAIVILSVIYNWAIKDAKLVKENPCADISLGSTGARDAILEDAADYEKLFRTLQTMEDQLRIRRPAADAIRLIALTGCRRGEAAGLLWRHVERARLVFLPREHKAGRRTGKPRIIALPSAAQAIIARQPEGGPNDYVFTPARGEGGAIELTHVWDKVRAEAKLPPKVTLHGLRHSTASHMAMAGAEAAQIMAALGHRQLSTVQRYIHFAKDARAALAETAAATALAGLAASEKKKPAKVVRMKGGRQ
jgi:integrase